MISKEEFLEAARIVSSYKQQKADEELQLVQEVKKLKRAPISANTLIKDCGLGRWALKGLGRAAGYFQIYEKNGLASEAELGIGHFKGIRLQELKKVPNLGAKSIYDIQEVFQEAGVNFEL